MIVKHKIQLDLVRRDMPQRIQAMQDDRYSRVLEIHLFAGGMEYLPPEDCAALVRYQKPDGTGGAYDTLPDGTVAWGIEGGVLTVALAPQVCTAPGTVELAVSLLRETAEISTFTLLVEVSAAPGGKASSREYVNIQAFMPQPGNLTAGQYLMVKEVDAYGNATVIGCGDGGAASVEIVGAERLSWEADPQAKAAPGSTQWNRKYILGIPAGIPGYSPVRGLDYWTAEDLAVMQQENQAYIGQELVKRTPFVPVFAADITQCVDENRLYVLSDGYVYSYADGAWQNSGYVFMPKGDQGDEGPQGAAGRDGYSLFFVDDEGWEDDGAGEWYISKEKVYTERTVQSGDFFITPGYRLLKVLGSGSSNYICGSFGMLKGPGISKIILEEAGLISFTIDSGEAYQAMEGMTWAQWCESEYNTEGRWFIKDSGYVWSAADEWLETSDGEMVMGDHIIQATDYILGA